MATMAEYECNHCGENDADHLRVIIFDAGSKERYTIPSFPVFTVGLREIKLQFLFDDDNDPDNEEKNEEPIFDGYAKSVPSLDRTFPSLAKVCRGCQNGFFIECEEFARSGISLKDKKLYLDKVFILWKWEWEEKHFTEADGSSSSCSGHITDESEGSDGSKKVEDNETEQHVDDIKHSVVFKCVGVTKNAHSQKLLAEISKKLRNQENVPVRLQPEPTNPKDSCAIVFECDLTSNHTWKPIGYVVREALQDVHLALQRGDIISVQFAWVRYITHWSSSGPGWYCGIIVTKKGLWSKEVVQHRSTI